MLRLLSEGKAVRCFQPTGRNFCYRCLDRLHLVRLAVRQQNPDEHKQVEAKIFRLLLNEKPGAVPGMVGILTSIELIVFRQIKAWKH